MGLSIQPFFEVSTGLYTQYAPKSAPDKVERGFLGLFLGLGFSIDPSPGNFSANTLRVEPYVVSLNTVSQILSYST